MNVTAERMLVDELPTNSSINLGIILSCGCRIASIQWLGPWAMKDNEMQEYFTNSSSCECNNLPNNGRAGLINSKSGIG